MDGDAVEALTVTRPGELELVSYWVHDAYFDYEDASFSEADSQATVAFSQESGWGDRHPSMPNPQLLKRTLFARHYRVPFVRCYLVFENALGLSIDDAGRGDPGMLNEVTFDASRHQVRIDAVVGPSIVVPVSDLILRVLVTQQVALETRRKVLGGWQAEADSAL